MLSSPGFPAMMMMGPAGRVLCTGPEAVSGNPALFLPGFTAAGGRWNLGTSAVSVAGGFSAGGSTGVGASMIYLGRGGIIRRDGSGQVTGEYSYSTGAVLAGASFQLLPWLRAGGAAGAAWENIDAGSGTGLAVSAGLAADIGPYARAGATVTGLGSAPEWNGISKAMPVEVSAGASWDLSEYLRLFGGTVIGVSTASTFAGGAAVSIRELSVSAGYAVTPGQDETTGLFGGLQYSYESGGTYIIELAFSQRDLTSWPVLAGISVRL